MKSLFVLTVIYLFPFITDAQCDTLNCTIPSSSINLNIDNLTNVTIASEQVVTINNMNGSGTIVNYGTLYLPNGIISRSITNYGTIIIAGNASIQNNSFLNNEQTGVVCVLGNTLIINSNSYIVNNGKFHINGNLHFNTYSHIFNADNGCMVINGNISMDENSTHCNSGQITVIGSINITNGGAFSACSGFKPNGGVINQNNKGSYTISNLCPNCIGPLGITLIDFYANSNVEGNKVYWITSNERNIRNYSLYHSYDGFYWERIYIENSREGVLNNYQYFHNINFEGNHYYYLNWIDNDGFIEKSEIIVINNSQKTKQIIQKTNLLGQSVDDYYNGVIIIQYTDGSTLLVRGNKNLK